MLSSVFIRICCIYLLRLLNMISRELQNRIMLLAIILYSAYMIVDLGVNNSSNFWDFEVYYHAADSEANVYSEGFASEMGDEHGALSYKYPPLTKYLFVPFTMLELKTAKLVWFAIILIISGMLVFVFSRIIKPNAPSYIWLVLLFGFNACFYTSLQTGNINVMVCLLIYLAFVYYLLGNYTLFVTFVLAASVFKLTPLLFLALLWIDGERKHLGISLFFTIVYLGLNALTPNFNDFIESLMTGSDERGIVNPSLYTFFGDIQMYISDKLNIGLVWLDEALYVMAIVAVGILSWKRLMSLESRSDKFVLVLLAGLLLLPRIKNYEYTLLLPIAMIMLIHWKHYFNAGWALIIFVLSAIRMSAPGTEFVFSLLWEYYPLILLLFMWYKHIAVEAPYQLKPFSLRLQTRG